jgi:hypothetical protein
VRFSPGFPPGAGFPGEQFLEELTTWVKTGFSRLQRGARSKREHSSPDCEPAGAASVEKGNPRNPAPGGNPGQKRTRLSAIFKKCIVKTTFKLKINTWRNPLNFKSIQ